MPRIRVKQVLLVLLSVAVSAALLVLVMQDVPLDDVLAEIGDVDAAWLLLCQLCIVMGLAVRGLRWALILRRRVPLLPAIHSVNVMALANQLPLRLGEVLRSYFALRFGISLATSASAIAAERVMDALLVTLLLGFGLSQLPSSTPAITQQAIFFGALALAGLGLLFGMARQPGLAFRVLHGCLRVLPILRRLPLEAILRDLLDGLQELSRLRGFAVISSWTLLAWLFSLGAYLALHLAMGIEVNLLASVPLGMALATFSIAVPLSIAALGAFEAAIVFSGQLVGMSAVDALALAVLFHGITVLNYVIWGGVGFVALGVSPGPALGIASSDDAAAL